MGILRGPLFLPLAGLPPRPWFLPPWPYLWGALTPCPAMFLSVVIPTYNRLPILRQCLQALEGQRLEAPLAGYEVVVVDDGSTDATVAWLEEAGAAGELPHLRLLRQEHGGPAQGRNRGVEAARGT
jgi:Glycosyltransferases involved in cell wall biogenesis